MRNTRSRRQQILQLLIEHGSVQVADLVERFGVSAVTIRADLTHFESQGLATRTHGGATLVRTPPQEQDIHEKDALNLPLKESIGTAAARLVLNRWQQQAWQGNYRQLLAQDSFQFKQIYNSRNPELALQQEALLAVLDQQPASVLQREAHRLAAMNIFLPDNQLLRQLVERTGDSALYLKLWRQPVDHDSVTALKSVARFHQGQDASSLLIAASRNSRLKQPALHQLSQLSPLPEAAQQFLLAELGNRHYSGQVASLLLQMDEPRLLAQFADRLTRQEKRHSSSVMLPDTGTPAAQPGL